MMIIFINCRVYFSMVTCPSQSILKQRFNNFFASGTETKVELILMHRKSSKLKESIQLSV